ncbi:unnamed protein product [Gordionus sp. m RMFG-2023]
MQSILFKYITFLGELNLTREEINNQKLKVNSDLRKQRELLRHDRKFFVREPKDIITNEGSSILLECALNQSALQKLTGFPIDTNKIEVQWYKNGEKIVYDSDIRRIHNPRYIMPGDVNKGIYDLIINNAQMKKDSGRWMCIVNNGIIKSLASTLNIVQIGVPSTPQTSTLTIPSSLRQNVLSDIQTYHDCLDDRFLVTMDFDLSENVSTNNPMTNNIKHLTMYVPASSFIDPPYIDLVRKGITKEAFKKNFRLKRKVDDLFHTTKNNCRLNFTYTHISKKSISFYIPYYGCGSTITSHKHNRWFNNITASINIVLIKNNTDIVFQKRTEINRNGWRNSFIINPPVRSLGTFTLFCYKLKQNFPIKINISEVDTVGLMFMPLNTSLLSVPNKRILPKDCMLELGEPNFNLEFNCESDHFNVSLQFLVPYIGDVRTISKSLKFLDICTHGLRGQRKYTFKIYYKQCSSNSSWHEKNSDSRTKHIYPLNEVKEYKTILYMEQHCARTFTKRNLECKV